MYLQPKNLENKVLKTDEKEHLCVVYHSNSIQIDFNNLYNVCLLHESG